MACICWAVKAQFRVVNEAGRWAGATQINTERGLPEMRSTDKCHLQRHLSVCRILSGRSIRSQIAADRRS